MVFFLFEDGAWEQWALLVLTNRRQKCGDKLHMVQFYAGQIQYGSNSVMGALQNVLRLKSELLLPVTTIFSHETFSPQITICTGSGTLSLCFDSVDPLSQIWPSHPKSN